MNLDLHYEIGNSHCQFRHDKYIYSTKCWLHHIDKCEKRKKLSGSSTGPLHGRNGLISVWRWIVCTSKLGPEFIVLPALADEGRSLRSQPPGCLPGVAGAPTPAPDGGWVREEYEYAARVEAARSQRTFHRFGRVRGRAVDSDEVLLWGWEVEEVASIIVYAFGFWRIS